MNVYWEPGQRRVVVGDGSCRSLMHREPSWVNGQVCVQGG